mgnify:CR=1 FL=1
MFSLTPFLPGRRLHIPLTISLIGTPACEAAYHEIGQWLQDGKMTARLDIREEFDRVPEIFDELFSGGNHGRLIVEVPD